MSHIFIKLAMLILASAPTQDAKLPTTLDLSNIRSITVQHDGRWPPLDTVARDLVEDVTGEQFYEGHDPVLLLLAWNFDPQTWKLQPLISIANAELRKEIQLPASQSVFSYTELSSHRHLRKLVDDLALIPRGQKMNPLESKVSDIYDKLTTLQMIFLGQAIKPIPDSDQAYGTWRSVSWFLRDDTEHVVPVKNAWLEVREAFLADDAEVFARVSDRLAEELQKLPAAHRPEPKLVATELHYNSLRPFRTAWIIMTVGAFLSVVALIVRQKGFDVIAILALIAGFAMLTYGLSMRWQIAGRIPASNMFESLLFLSWGMGAFAIVAMLVQRQRIVPLTTSVMGALSLFLADVLPMDHYIRPIAPVLMDTIWMSIHVPIIMVSYSVLALAVLIAHVQLAVMAAAPRRQQLINTLDSLHYWYVHVGAILLFVGIVTGSMWAASSWGRYWGWDPKEVWSLVAFLGYLAILHVRIDREKVPLWAYVTGAILGIALILLIVPKLVTVEDPKLFVLAGTGLAMVFFVTARGQFATAVKSILAFWMIIMTYVGVNYVLGIGLHSYGFGTGAVASHMMMIGWSDLSLVALCSVIYLVRRQALTSAPLVTKAVTRDP